MYILGISAYYHDSAACLIKDGEIVSAVQEERFSRIKHDSAFPCESIRFCIQNANIGPNQITNIVFYEKPFIKFERLLETYLAFAPKGFKSFAKSMPLWIKDKLFQKRNIVAELENLFGKGINWQDKLLFSEHHLSHAASAFFPSPFESAAVLTIDGVGEWTTASLAIGKGRELHIKKEIHFPHSLGLLYSAFTYYAGFKVNSGEYKVMGLAPYGKPKYADLIKEKIINIAEDGTFQLDMSYFNYATGLTMTSNKFHNLFGSPPRKPETEITQREMDLAASVQRVIEEVVIKLAKSIRNETKEKNLCLAGGVALNCVSNGVLLKENIFKNIWIQPAAGDAGGAVGAALCAWYLKYKNKRTVNPLDSMKGSYLGPEFNDEEIEAQLKSVNGIFTKHNYDELINQVSDHLVAGKAIGWMNGRMEFGPRALGARSIIADPRVSDMQKKLNLKVKFRESFRPFAPSVLFKYVDDWFDQKVESPYMLFVSKLKENRKKKISSEQEKLFGIDKLNVIRSKVPAITHVDYSARIQTVHEATNPRYHKLLSAFYEKTGCPILVNTSFNIRGEPIVCTPKDAFRCFMGTDLDVLVIGNFVLIKENQDQNLVVDYQEQFSLD